MVTEIGPAHRAQHARTDLMGFQRDDEEQAADPRIFFIQHGHVFEGPYECAGEILASRDWPWITLAPFAEHFVDHGEEKFLFVAEVPVEGTLGDAGRAGDAR